MASHVAPAFDDSPTPGITDRLPDTLNRHNIKAAFFGVSQKANPSASK